VNCGIVVTDFNLFAQVQIPSTRLVAGVLDIHPLKEK